MKHPRHAEFEALRARATALGREGSPSGYRELTELLKSGFPIVRKAAAGAMVKILEANPSLAPLCAIPLVAAAVKETGEQILDYQLRALSLCAGAINAVELDALRDIVRNPNHRPYARERASEVISQVERVTREMEARKRHWCARCRRPVTAAESAAGIERYGKPYCRHCLNERRFEDIRFNADVEKAKRLRTTDGVAVQSHGERRIGSWLAAHHISYFYDERITVAGDIALRPDFYLPEFDVYIEYWGMDTPEYLANMEKKRFLYRRDRKKLISLSYRDDANLERLLELKLSRYCKLGSDSASTPSPLRPPEGGE